MDCENWNWVSIRVLRPGARSTKALTSEHDDSMMYINKFDTYIVEGNVNAGNGTGKNQKKKHIATGYHCPKTRVSSPYPTP